MESVIITYFQTIFKHEVHIIWSKHQALIFQPFVCSSTASYKMLMLLLCVISKCYHLLRISLKGVILFYIRIAYLYYILPWLFVGVFTNEIFVSFITLLSVHICWYIMTRLFPFLKKSNKGTSKLQFSFSI